MWLRTCGSAGLPIGLVIVSRAVIECANAHMAHFSMASRFVISRPLAHVAERYRWAGGRRHELLNFSEAPTSAQRCLRSAINETRSAASRPALHRAERWRRRRR